jgi:hypothetical protein
MKPTQQDKAVQVDQLAGNATRACFARFRSCIAALDGEHRNHLEVRFADLKLWADSVGALAYGKASLDWRLSERSRDIFLITSLLDMLEQFLEGYKTAAIEGGDEDEIEEAEQGRGLALRFGGPERRRGCKRPTCPSSTTGPGKTSSSVTSCGHILSAS